MWGYFGISRIDLHRCALILKHPKSAEEKEWRIISRNPMMEDVLNKKEDAPLDVQESTVAFR